MTGRMPTDPFTAATCGGALTRLVAEGEMILLALAEAAGRGAFALALDALTAGERRAALFSWLLDARLSLRARVRRGDPIAGLAPSVVRHFEAPAIGRELIVAVVQGEDRPAARAARRLDALTDEEVEALLGDLLQVRR